MPLDHVDLQSRLYSQLFGAMVVVIELTGAHLHADLGAGRVFRAPRRLPASYASSRRLALDDHQACELLHWPEKQGSLLSILPYQELTESVFRPRDVLPERSDDPTLFHPINESTAVQDSLCACVPLDDQVCLAMAWLRCGHSSPFTLQDVRTVMGLYAQFQQRLRNGYNGDTTNHGPAKHNAPTVQNHDEFNALFQRLSTTEQHVLMHLRSGMTERAVAEALNRSRHTVHVHVKSIYRKLGVYSRRELMDMLEHAD